MKVHLDTRCGIGFGDYLCMISLFCDVPEPIELYTNNRDRFYDSLVTLTRILNIPESKLKIIYTEENGDFAGAWHVKTVSNYYEPTSVNLNGREVIVNRNKRDAQEKQYIGIVCFNDTDIYLDSNYDLIRLTNGRPVNEGNNGQHVPQCKWRNLDYYSRVFHFARTMGYDVITLDSRSSIELKIENLLTNCAAVIGCEGGIAHLCHMLGIPYFILDWRTPNLDHQYGEFQVDVCHQHNTSYIMRDDSLLNLGITEFTSLVKLLWQGKNSNNRLINGDYKMEFVCGVNSPIKFVDRLGNAKTISSWGPQVSQAAADFIHKFYPKYFPNLA
jgi:hypothetical protein